MIALWILTILASPAELDAALARAGGRPVILYVGAEWCSPCNDLRAEVLEGPETVAQLGATVVHVDFDTPEGQAVTERYAIIDLPTSVIVDPKGRELSRVAGYPGRTEYLEAVRDALRERSSLDAARAGTGEAARLDVAEALLVRGNEAEAAPLFSAYFDRSDDLGARATRVWGRYLLRVRKRAVEAEAHFRAAAERFRGLPAEGSFIYWAARACDAQGKRDEAVALFDAWGARAPASQDPALEKADFLVQVGAEAGVCEQAIRAAEPGGKELGWLAYLLAQVRLKQGDCGGARAAVKRARELEPGPAIYRNFEGRLAKECASP